MVRGNKLNNNNNIIRIRTPLLNTYQLRTCLSVGFTKTSTHPPNLCTSTTPTTTTPTTTTTNTPYSATRVKFKIPVVVVPSIRTPSLTHSNINTKHCQASAEH
ncbi:hypothetical protein Pcinc_037581 [Petrolisthes cinctipes]|uniref:Uncharacterized protein n=1 Tax=Petrolisthes cinctipes TaxID=88211 RepID=A0AAE1BS89_PETCI|nr:hypothetical protein Pcinc_037581 [Petrolisthes cinctipes]